VYVSRISGVIMRSGAVLKVSNRRAQVYDQGLGIKLSVKLNRLWVLPPGPQQCKDVVPEPAILVEPEQPSYRLWCDLKPGDRWVGADGRDYLQISGGRTMQLYFGVPYVYVGSDPQYRVYGKITNYPIAEVGRRVWINRDAESGETVTFGKPTADSHVQYNGCQANAKYAADYCGGTWVYLGEAY
jgi:hypothetical protein